MLFTACLFLCAAPSLADMPKQLSITKTVQDIKRAPPIAVSPSMDVKLGISAKEVPCYTPLFFYCLVRTRLAAEIDVADLGPLSVSIGGITKSIGKRRANVKLSEGTWLFAKEIAFAKAGDYRVQIKDTQGRVVFADTVRCTKEGTEPWILWGWKNDFSDMTVSDFDQIVIPHWDNSRAFQVKNKADELRLPGSTFDARLVVTSQGANVIRVRSQEKMIVSRPNSRFALKIWINGKPVVPSQSKAFDEIVRELIQRDNEIVFELRLHNSLLPKADKVKTVDLVMLYSESGFFHCSSSLKAHNAFGESGRTWSSNKIRVSPDWVR